MTDRPAQRLDRFGAQRRTLSIIDPDSPYRITPKGDYKKPAFVKFDPKDDAANLDEIFWEGERESSILLREVQRAVLICSLEDPYTFTPRRCRNGYVEHWGLYPVRTRSSQAVLRH